jgi:CRISPR associated protein Cas1
MSALRPVYIDRGAGAVRLDGPALVVEEPERSEGRFPLRLLSRIVVRGPVPWSMEALFACLAAGIPVTFLSLEGEVVGLCLGREHPEESLAMLLDRLTGEPGWAEIYGRWCRAAERRAVVETVRRLGLPLGGACEGTDLRPETVQALLLARLPGGDTPGARSAMLRLDGFLYAHTAELLARGGVPLCYRGGRGAALDLRPAFRTALRWYLWAPLARWLELTQRHPPADRTRARRRGIAQYEAAAPQIAARFRRLLGSLDRFLREELP